jgi:UDPglucose 6-dehydrogenase
MNIVVLGTGYVGLVSGACFAEKGHNVTCVDIDSDKISSLSEGKIPFFEPGLGDLVKNAIGAGHLSFQTTIPTSNKIDLYFVCVGTPSRADGSSNMDYVYQCVEQIARIDEHATIVVKSTVPIGTNKALRNYLDTLGKKNIRLASNPEFLREGSAVEDSLKPDRVIIGAHHQDVSDDLTQLYLPFFQHEPTIFTVTPESSEMIKYASNCYLAMRISFINEISQLCEETGADISEVKKGMGADNRIGDHYLNPSVGIGGSCFPKDLRSLKSAYDEKGLRPEILTAVLQTNQNQKNRFFKRMEAHFERDGGLLGKKVAIWGTAFKANTDDIRESAALDIIQRLLDARANVSVFDPEAGENTKAYFGEKIAVFDDMYEALASCDALCILTEWEQFKTPDFDKIKQKQKSPVIFDGRNLLNPIELKNHGFVYHSIGRKTL